jgi:hypothetical protein
MTVEGTIQVGKNVYTFTCDSSNKERAAELIKDDIYQDLHEANLDKCKGWKWATEQSHKIMNKLDKAEVIWREI